MAWKQAQQAVGCNKGTTVFSSGSVSELQFMRAYNKPNETQQHWE